MASLIASAAKFLQTPADPPRPLEEKIRFLIKEKKLTQYQLIAALKQANLYNIDTLEPILRMHYFEQSNQSKKTMTKTNSNSSSQTRDHPSTVKESSESSSWSPWWATLGTISVGLASFVGSYTASTTASQKLVNKSEAKTNLKLDSVKTQIKEQADLDRECQHRDLMEVVSLLKTQVQCVQENLGVLKQSIEVIQTQMKYNGDQHMMMNSGSASMMIQNNNRNSNLLQLPRSNNGGDDRSVISSNHSIQSDPNKPNLNAIGNLLSAGTDGVDWLHSDIITSTTQPTTNTTSISTEEKTEDHHPSSKSKSSSEIKRDDIDSEHHIIECDEMEDIPLIYHEDYKEMIKSLPTDIVEIKQQLTDLLHLWQRTVATKSDDLTVDKLKSGCNALSFYINKILKRPFAEPMRKINVYNKQYKERLSTLPRIETLLTVIGYEKDNVFWTLPLLYKENADSNGNTEEQKHLHDVQIEFLKAFKDILSNLFNVDGTLPVDLRQNIQRIKREKLDQENEERKKEMDASGNGMKGNESNVNNVMNSGITNVVDQNAINSIKGINGVNNAESNNVISNGNGNGNVNVNGNSNGNGNGNGNVEQSKAPETQYSSKFMEVAQLVSQGKKPDDVQVIDDMPPDPNAPPSESKMSPQKKPFEMENEEKTSGLSWFEQYEARQQNQNGNIAVSNVHNEEATDGDQQENDDNAQES